MDWLELLELDEIPDSLELLEELFTELVLVVDELDVLLTELDTELLLLLDDSSSSCLANKYIE